MSSCAEWLWMERKKALTKRRCRLPWHENIWHFLLELLSMHKFKTWRTQENVTLIAFWLNKAFSYSEIKSNKHEKNCNTRRETNITFISSFITKWRVRYLLMLKYLPFFIMFYISILYRPWCCIINSGKQNYRKSMEFKCFTSLLCAKRSPV